MSNNNKEPQITEAFLMDEYPNLCDGIDLQAIIEPVDSDEEDDWHSSSPVKYFEHDSIRGRLRRTFIKNSTGRLTSTIFDFTVKILVCLLYVVRVCLDDTSTYECIGSPCGNSTSFQEGDVNWYVLLWVDRPLPLWVFQVFFAFLTFSKALLNIYIAKTIRFGMFFHANFIIELVSSLPLIVTVFYPPILESLFVPSFLNCWLAKKALDRLLNDLHRTRQRFQTISVTLSQQVMILTATLLCLVFTTICGIQHIQRASSETRLDMFSAFYFVIVTFSTVGYGDLSPDIWPSQLFMILMICVAFAFIPMQIQMIASTMIERSKVGKEFTKRQAGGNKHVVVISRQLQAETVMDLLLEFYAHPKLETHIVVLLAAQEMDSNLQVILKDPKWSHRVIFLRGSALKDSDLKRCRIQHAEACFVLAPRNCPDKTKADHHTIMRSWAVKDFAPKCKQYIQLFKPDHKIHVKFAEHVICEDEFKYALLANNCLYPGLSTLVSLIVHTSGGLYGKDGTMKSEGDMTTEQWQQTYGRHSGNEIYHIQLGRSAFFSRYEGKKFTEASADAHMRFGISLVAVLDTTVEEPHLQLNPGPEHILKSSDFCFYMSVTKEEYSKIQPDALRSDNDTNTQRTKNMERMVAELQRMLETDEEEEDDGEEESVFNTITSQMGYQLANRIRRATFTPGVDQPPTLATNLNSSPLQQNEKDKDKEEQKSHDFDHIDGTDPPKYGQVLNNYEDMGQDEPTPSSVFMFDFETSILENISNMSIRERDPFLRDRPLYQLPNNNLPAREFITGPPPVSLYVGSKRAICHLMKEKRPVCCLEWGVDCKHCKYKNTNDERWTHQLIILAAEHANNGIYNFIVPLRSQFIGMKSLCPIILLLEEEPDNLFLESISYFPLVYWMIGKITSVDDLLKAGINKASHLVVVNRKGYSDEGEDILGDSQTIIAVQTIFKLFPNAHIITELSQTSNMRFMHFRAHDEYSQKISGLERKIKSSMSSNLNHIFRLPFAAGQVFSASMLDTLLYQTFVKGYLITFVRLLLGIDAEEKSGHLSSIRIKRTTIARYRTYGELYQGLCATTGEIPIALYRTDQQATNKAKRTNNNESLLSPESRKLSSMNIRQGWNDQNPEQEDISDLIRNRMKSLDLSSTNYCDTEIKKNDISYVILNPSPKRKLRTGDLVYVIQPSTMNAIPTRFTRKRQNVKRKSWTPPMERKESSTGFRDRTHSLNGAEVRFEIGTKD